MCRAQVQMGILYAAVNKQLLTIKKKKTLERSKMKATPLEMIVVVGRWLSGVQYT